MTIPADGSVQNIVECIRPIHGVSIADALEMRNVIMPPVATPPSVSAMIHRAVSPAATGPGADELLPFLKLDVGHL